MALTLVNTFLLELAKGTHDLSTDTFKAILTNTAVTQSMTKKSDLTSIANGGGYTSAGLLVTVTSLGQTSGTVKWVLQDLTIQASGASIGPFQWVVIINDSAPNDEIVGYVNLGAPATLADTQIYIIDFDGTAGAWTASPPAS